MAPIEDDDTPRVDGSVAWRAYAIAWKRRYGLDAARNAKGNSILAHFVRRIPGPDVVATVTRYLESNNARYVASGHSLECLLRDAEKLRAEALTGRRGTATAAMRADKTEDRGDQYAEMFDELRAVDAQKGQIRG